MRCAETLARYLLLNSNTLCEIQCVKETPSSWFVGDQVIAGAALNSFFVSDFVLLLTPDLGSDGSLYMCTRIDPLFLALAPLEAARKKVLSSQLCAAVALSFFYFC
jgi:hypothetical protein